MTIVLANNAHTTLSSGISSTDTVLYVDDVDSFPSLGVNEYFYATIESTSGAYEIVKVTQTNSSSFNVTRAQEDTIAIPFSTGARVELRLTVQSLEDQFVDTVDDVVDAAVTAAIPGLISDTAYGVGWDGVTTVAPSKNAVYDELSAIETSISALGSVISLRGTWDASAGTFPGSGTAKAGYSYIVSVAGTVDGRSFIAGDRVIAITNNASTTTYANNWFHADYTDAVSSVAGRTGAVTLTTADLTDTSSNGRSLITAANYSAMRTLLGLGTMALETASNYALLSGAVFTGNVDVQGGRLRFGASADAIFERVTANVIGMRNGTSSQQFRVYNTYTDDSNYEAFTTFWNANVATLRPLAAGTGTQRAVEIMGGTGATLSFGGNGATQWQVTASGHLIAPTDITYDIGQSGATRPRNIYAGAVIVTDDAYAAGWDGSSAVPTKNAIYDKIQSLGVLSDGDKGDITVSASGATWTIDANTVTLAKMATMATDSILGRATASTGNVEVLTALPWAFTGDVTSTADSNALTIANSAVTLAKMANMATSSLIYRKTAGTGAPEVNTLATLKTDLGLTGTNSGDQTITLTGNVTGSGTGSFAATIANNAVTLAKMATMATDSILGRATAATGNVEVLTALPFAFTGDVTRAADSNAQTIANDAVTYAKMQNVSAQYRLLGRSTAGAGDVEEITSSANMFSLLGSADYSTARTNLGLAIGSNVQAYSAILAALAASSNITGTITVSTSAPSGGSSGDVWYERAA